jgi:hypothetical protein
MGITEVITAPRSPWQNPYAERLIVRSAATVWITLSSSMNVTWAAYCRAIFNIIMTPERISRSTRTAHGLVAYTFPSRATLLPSRSSAVCIIAMSVEPREIGEAVRSACPHPIAGNLFLSKDWITDARADGDIWLTRAGAPCALIHEPGLGGNALSQNPASATNHGARLTQACAGDAVRLVDLGRD